MTTMNNIPFKATPPGVLIKDELEARSDINQKNLAREIGVKASFLNEIIKGKRPVTADIAILLEKTLGISADYWMRFQSQYEIDKARVKEKNIKRLRNIELWGIVKEYVPVKYFRKHKYLTDNLDSDIETIKDIYSAQTIDELISNAAKNKWALYRKSDKLKIDEKNMFAWSSLAYYEAKRQKTNTFNIDNIPQLCVDLNKVFHENNHTVEGVKKLLNQYGIKFITIEKLEKTPVDGFSFWSGNNPAVALTLRYSRIDNFAFTLLHEIGHIELHLQNNKEARFVDFSSDKRTGKLEKEADRFAQEKLIPDNIWEEINTNYLPLNDDKLIEMGNAYQINPAILLGRICYETNNYAYKTKIDKKIK